MPGYQLGAYATGGYGSWAIVNATGHRVGTIVRCGSSGMTFCVWGMVGFGLHDADTLDAALAWAQENI